ncbi:MAG: PHP domain-containing protein [Candidatus Doudnabacteria bacterium]
MKIDTHVHTTCSDGRKTAAEVIELASSLGIRLLAITDHDTLDPYPGAFAVAERWQIDLVPGVELSTKDEDGYREVHVLGLKVDTENRQLRLELAKLADARIGARRQMLDNVNAYLTQKYPGWEPVRFDDVRRRVPGNIVGKPHLAAALFESAKKSGVPLKEEELFVIFRTPGIQTKKAYELTMGECIRLVRHAGGVPTLAHPCEYARPGEVMEKFAWLGGEATEICKYRSKTKMPAISGIPPDDRIAVERRMNEETIKLAKKHGLKLTASSDYHGKIGEPGMETDEYGIDVRWLLA